MSILSRACRTFNPELLPSADAARCPLCRSALVPSMGPHGPRVWCACEDEVDPRELAPEIEELRDEDLCALEITWRPSYDQPTSDPYADRIAAAAMYRSAA
jgi:hypothetical protein